MAITSLKGRMTRLLAVHCFSRILEMGINYEKKKKVSLPFDDRTALGHCNAGACFGLAA